MLGDPTRTLTLPRQRGREIGCHYFNMLNVHFRVKDAKIVKLYEIDPSTNIVSGSLQESARIARVIADLEADIVIGAQGD